MAAIYYEKGSAFDKADAMHAKAIKVGVCCGQVAQEMFDIYLAMAKNKMADATPAQHDALDFIEKIVAHRAKYNLSDEEVAGLWNSYR